MAVTKTLLLESRQPHYAISCGSPHFLPQRTIYTLLGLADRSLAEAANHLAGDAFVAGRPPIIKCAGELSLTPLQISDLLI